MSTPLLSICIPTYNRATLLAKALQAVGPQVQANEETELIVSDNCSTDETPTVVERAQSRWPIRYHRNESNIGISGNTMRLTHQLSQGEFCWLIGDDDIVLPGGVNRICEIISNNNESDYFFVNAAVKPSNERATCERTSYDPTTLDLKRTVAASKSNWHVPKWEQLLDPDLMQDHSFFGAMMTSIFKLSRVRQYSLTFESGAHLFPNLEATYPVAVMLAHTMVGTRAYYVGEPCILAFWGDQEWRHLAPLLTLVRLQSLLDLFCDVGIDRGRIEKCRRDLLYHSASNLQAIIFSRDTPGREEFSLSKFLWRNRYNPIPLGKILLWFLLLPQLETKIPHPRFPAKLFRSQRYLYAS